MKKIPLVMLFVLLLLAPQAIHAENSEGRSRYDLKIVVDVENFVISGTESVIYYNNSGVELDELYFTLYPNAFDDGEGIPAVIDEETYPNGFDPGYIDIEVREHEYSIIDDIFLKIDLSSPLGPGETENIYMDFEIKIPEMKYRFGHYEDIIYAGNCFPQACVYMDGQWALYPYISRGDPFFSEAANWNIDLMLDRDWELATSGTVVKKFENGLLYEYEIEAPLTRDYAFSCSPSYESLTGDYNDITIYSYYMPGHEIGGAYSLQYAIDSIELFEEIYGDYPYESFTIAETHLGVGAGMEYPQLVFIDSYYYDIYDESFFEITVVHEVAHQWWYSVVGNDEYKESYIDESLAQYSTLMYFKNYYENYRESYYMPYIMDTYITHADEAVNIIDLPLDEFASDPEYFLMAYIKAPIVLDIMSMYTGQEEFLEYLSQLYNENMYSIIDGKHIIDSMNEHFGDAMAGDIFETMIRTDAMPDAFAGESFKEDGHYNINILYINELEIPVEVKLEYSDGTSELLGPLTNYTGTMEKTIERYVIDPRELLIEENEDNNIGYLIDKPVEKEDDNDYVLVGLALILLILISYTIIKRKK